MRVLVADKLAEEGLELLKSSGVDFEVKVGLKEDELAGEVGGFDALIVRSGAKVTARVLENSGKLRAIARAGVGVDNIDCDAATRKGILVMNTAEASTFSTAEHALALMLSLARKIPQAHAALRSGQLDWKKRSVYQGTQLAGKTLGVVGMGRIGRTVAARALAFDMDVLAFDPFFTAPTALDGKVRLVRDFDQFLAELDIITFHVPGGESTRHLLNRDRLFTKCKANLLVVNDSRGEVVDEFALAEALQEKKIAGAAIDVYQTEPPQKDHPLFGLDNAVLTPHLGASTDEAQTAVSVDACKAILAYLETGEIRGAVNAGGIKLDLPADEAPLADLARRMGMVLPAMCDKGYKTIVLRAHGARAQKLATTLLRLATVELLRATSGENINVINVEHFARSRGVEMTQITETNPPAGMAGDVIELRVDLPGGESHRLLGTVYADRLPRVVRLDGFAMDMVPEGTMVLVLNEDQPGVIGMVGNTFGAAGVNIANMAISRSMTEDQKVQLMMIKTDSMAPESLLSGLRAKPKILRVKAMMLPPR